MVPSPTNPSLRVCLVQPVVPSYRDPIFSRLARIPGIELSVWAGMTSPGSPPTTRKALASAYTFRRSPTRRLGPFLFQPAQLEAVGSRSRFDVVILSWNVRYLHLGPALLRARLHGVKTILWGHGPTGDARPISSWLRITTGRLADAVLLYSQPVAVSILRGRALPARKVFVADNALDQSTIHAARSRWQAEPDRLRRFQQLHGIDRAETAIFISRLLPEKRVDLLIRAMASVRRRRPHARLVIIGDGPARSSLMALTADLAAEDAVRFVGALYNELELAPWCLSASLFALPRAVGISLLHAFGYGLPVITADENAGNGPEMAAFQPDVNGLFFRPSDEGDLAAKIDFLLSHADVRERMSRAAAATVSTEQFSAERMLSAMSAAINAVSRSALAARAAGP